jgi:hypothetical protein
VRRLTRVPAALRWAGLAAVLLLASVPAISALEERDSFCIACHTAPEVTYYNRAQAARAGDGPPLDLSSAHYAGEGRFRCIDCHRGNGGLAHRAATLALGARDALIYFSGRADQAIEKTEIEAPNLLTGGCVACHADALLVAGFENHFHNKLPDAYAAWQAGGEITAPPDGQAAAALEPSDTALRCLDCHLAHIHAPGAALTGYLDLENVTLPACVRCHRETGHGPLDLIGGQ